jgi:hypothetical protein
MAAGRFAQQPLAHQSVQSIEALAHVGRPERKINLGRWSQAKTWLGLLQCQDQFAQSCRVKAGPYSDPGSLAKDHLQVALCGL